MCFGILVRERVVNVASASGDSKQSLDSQLIGSQWIMLNGDAGASEIMISGQVTTVSPGSVHLDLGREDFCSRLG